MSEPALRDGPLQDPPQGGESKGWFWPILVVGLLLAQVVLMLVLWQMATRDQSFAVEPGYYDKALHWDDTMAQRRLNAKLAWSVALRVGDDPGPLGERSLICRVTDQQGAPVEGAELRVIAFPHRRAGDRRELRPAAAGDGRYSARMMFRRLGLWEFRVTVVRGQDTFTWLEQRDVMAPGKERP